MNKNSLFLGFGLLLTSSGCTGGLGLSGEPSSSGQGDRPGGTVRFQLSTVAGIDVQEVSYSIQPPSGDPIEGKVELTDANSEKGIVVENVPVANDVAVSLHASAANDIECAGEGKVDVVAGKTTPVAIVLQCKLPDGAPLPDPTGSINVQTSVNICPQLAPSADGLSVSANARDQDGDALTYTWSASAGSFADASADQTTYTCAESGEQTLSVSVRDAKGCETSKDVVVTCAAEQPPADQPPADQPPADQPPADQPPADQPPADQPPADQPPAEGSQIPCDVQAILASRCQSCHGEPLANGAPMPIVTLADVKAPDDPGTYMYQNMEERIQSTTRPMPPKGLPALTDDERATLVAWLDQGAPGSDVMCEPPAN